MERKQVRSGVWKWGGIGDPLEHAGREGSRREYEGGKMQLGVMCQHLYYHFQNERCLTNQILPNALDTLISKFKFHFNSSQIIWLLNFQFYFFPEQLNSYRGEQPRDTTGKVRGLLIPCCHFTEESKMPSWERKWLAWSHRAIERPPREWQLAHAIGYFQKCFLPLSERENFRKHNFTSACLSELWKTN